MIEIKLVGLQQVEAENVYQEIKNKIEGCYYFVIPKTEEVYIQNSVNDNDSWVMFEDVIGDIEAMIYFDTEELARDLYERDLLPSDIVEIQGSQIEVKIAVKL